MSATETMIWEGAEALKPYLVPVGDLTPSEENPRKGDVLALVGSLRRFGQVRAIAVTEGGTVVAGHHLRLAAIEMGWTHIAAVPNEFKSDEERIAYLLADNQLASLGGYDEQAQLALFERQGTNLEGLGITMDDVEDLQAKMGSVSESAAPADLARGSAEDAQAAAERAAALANSRSMREVVLMVTGEQHEWFGEQVKKLQKHYKSEEVQAPGIVYTVLRAVGERADGLGAPE